MDAINLMNPKYIVQLHRRNTVNEKERVKTPAEKMTPVIERKNSP